MNAKDAVSEAMDLTQLKTKFEGYLDNGEFLPLGAWVVRGYDPELIVANAGADDIRETKMAGHNKAASGISQCPAQRQTEGEDLGKTTSCRGVG